MSVPISSARSRRCTVTVTVQWKSFEGKKRKREKEVRAGLGCCGMYVHVWVCCVEEEIKRSWLDLDLLGDGNVSHCKNQGRGMSVDWVSAHVSRCLSFPSVLG